MTTARLGQATSGQASHAVEFVSTRLQPANCLALGPQGFLHRSPDLTPEEPLLPSLGLPLLPHVPSGAQQRQRGLSPGPQSRGRGWLWKRRSYPCDSGDSTGLHTSLLSGSSPRFKLEGSLSPRCSVALGRPWPRAERQLGMGASVCSRQPVATAAGTQIESARRGPGVGRSGAEHGEVSGTALVQSTRGLSEAGRALSWAGPRQSRPLTPPRHPVDPLVSQVGNQSPEWGVNLRELHSSVETGQAWETRTLYSSKCAGTRSLGLWDRGLRPQKRLHSATSGSAAFPRVL